MSVTHKELIDWALLNGFSHIGDDEYSIAYQNSHVVLSFLKRNVRVIHRVDGQDISLGSFDLRSEQIRLNRFGMIDGIGLSGSFVMRLPQPIKLEDMPPWFSTEYWNEAMKAMGSHDATSSYHP